MKKKKVEIILCTAVGSQFANLTPGSIHEVVKCPKEHMKYKYSVWVMGVGERVRLLRSEYKFVD